MTFKLSRWPIASCLRGTCAFDGSVAGTRRVTCVSVEECYGTHPVRHSHKQGRPFCLRDAASLIPRCSMSPELSLAAESTVKLWPAQLPEVNGLTTPSLRPGMLATGRSARTRRRIGLHGGRVSSRGAWALSAPGPAPEGIGRHSGHSWDCTETLQDKVRGID